MSEKDLNSDTGEVMIGIVGGMGPETGTLLQRFIIEETAKQKVIKKDQDHLPVVHLSAPSWINDLSDSVDLESVDGVLRVVEIFEQIARSQNGKILVGVPSNAFHLPAIFNKLESLVEEAGFANVEILNMIKETKSYISKHFPNIKKVGLISTTITRNNRIFHDVLEPMGYEIIEVEEAVQEEVYQTISNPEWGVKAVSPALQKVKDNFEEYAMMLQDQGAELIILGCPEIEIALPGLNFRKTPLIDPVRALARALVLKVINY